MFDVSTPPAQVIEGLIATPLAVPRFGSTQFGWEAGDPKKWKHCLTADLFELLSGMKEADSGMKLYGTREAAMKALDEAEAMRKKRNK